MKRLVNLTLVLSLILSLATMGMFVAHAEEPTEIIFWTALSGKNGDAIQHLADEFNASQTQWKVSPEYQGTYYDITAKLQAAVVSGETPEITQMECARTVMFANYGIFEDISAAAEEYGLDTSGFYPVFMQDCDWGEGLYALPFNRSTPMFYYNKTLFDENGLTAPTNWEELHETAKALSIPNERWGFEVPIDNWFYSCFVVQSGGSLMNEDKTDIGFNNESGWAGIELLRSMLADDSMKAPPGAEYSSWEVARSDFASGISAMIMTSTGDVASLRSTCDFELGMAFLPANERYAAVTGGANVAVLAGHEDKMEGIMAFLKFLTSPESAGWWAATTGYVPTSEAASEVEIYHSYLEEFPMGAVTLQQLEYAACQGLIPEWPEIINEFVQSALERCIEDESYTPQQATQDVSNQTRELLGTN